MEPCAKLVTTTLSEWMKPFLGRGTPSDDPPCCGTASQSPDISIVSNHWMCLQPVFRCSSLSTLLLVDRKTRRYAMVPAYGIVLLNHNPSTVNGQIPGCSFILFTPSALDGKTAEYGRCSRCVIYMQSAPRVKWRGWHMCGAGRVFALGGRTEDPFNPVAA